MGRWVFSRGAGGYKGVQWGEMGGTEGVLGLFVAQWGIWGGPEVMVGFGGGIWGGSCWCL